MKKFCHLWGIKQRISSAYNPVSNKRAEVGVKSAKRLIRDNVGPDGSLNTNQFIQALLAHRNSPDPATGVSPAQIVFGHQIRDIIPSTDYTPQSKWSDLARKREDCFLRRHYMRGEKLDAQAKALKQLKQGDTVYIQNQTGPSPKSWDKSGQIVQCLPHDSFLIKIDGSNHLTKRNRRFLRQFTPFSEACMDTRVTAPEPASQDDGSRPNNSSCTPPQPRRSPRNHHQKFEAPVVSNCEQSNPTQPHLLDTVNCSLVDTPLVVALASMLLSSAQDSQIASPVEDFSRGGHQQP